jgi:hypothetical protein
MVERPRALRRDDIEARAVPTRGAAVVGHTLNLARIVASRKAHEVTSLPMRFRHHAGS